MKKMIKKLGVTAFALTLLLNTLGVMAANSNEPNLSLLDPDRSISLTITRRIGSNANNPGTTGAPLVGTSHRLREVELIGGTTSIPLNPVEGRHFNFILGGMQTRMQTNANGVVRFDAANGLTRQGIFFVEEVGTNATMQSFLVALPTWRTSDRPGGSGTTPEWQYDVRVYPKDDPALSITKNGIPVGPGDILRWNIEATIPAGIGDNGTFYRITDVLDSRLSFVAGTHSPVITYRASNASAPGVVLNPVHYEWVVSGQTIDFRLTSEGMIYLNDFPNGVIRIEFDTRVANIDTSIGEIPNNARVEYATELGNDPGPGDPWEPEDPNYELTTDEDDDEQPVFALDIIKENVAGEVLQGASFALFTSQADAQAFIDNDFTAPPAPLRGVTTTGSNGRLSTRWYGLTAGIYWLVETQAPTGYQLIANPMEVVIGHESATEDNIGNYYFGVEVTVVNDPLTDLPFTGGAGLTLLVIVALGSIALGTMAIVVDKKRRQSTM